MRYVLAPNGNLESGTTGWTLTGGAKVEAENESFFVGSKSDKRSLYLPSGSTATTRPMCVQLLHPTFRYFAKNRGTILLSTLLVEALVENPLTGRVLVLPAGVHTGGSKWHPSLPGLVLADLLTLLDKNGELAVAFRFRPVGLGAKLADRRRLRRSVQEPLGNTDHQRLVARLEGSLERAHEHGGGRGGELP